MDGTRRLSDAIIAAHETACSEGKKDVAVLLLEALELDLSTIGGAMTDHRDDTAPLEAAFERHAATFPES